MAQILPEISIMNSVSLNHSYISFIKACYNPKSDASLYYRNLENYLASAGAATRLQKITSVVLRPLPKPIWEFCDFETTGLSLPRLNIIEGFPSPECLGALGARYKIRPELFVGHLDFQKNECPGPDFYTLPTLPSMRENIFHVRLVSLGAASAGRKSLKSLSAQRAEVDATLNIREEKLFRERRYGETRLRAMHFYDSSHFTVEQMVSFTFSWGADNSWIGKFVWKFRPYITDRPRKFPTGSGKVSRW